MKEEVGCKRTDTAEVVNCKRDESSVLSIEGGDDVFTLSGVGCASLEFRADAGQVGP